MKRSSLYVLLFIASGLSLAIFLYAQSTVQELRSKASAPPTSALVPPYVRLATPEDSYSVNDPIAVDVYLHTNTIPTLETFLVLRYDPMVLAISPSDIGVKNIYPVTQVESVEDGRIAMSLFVTQEAGYEPIALAQEAKVATIVFHPRRTATTTSIDVDTSAQEGSGVYTRKEPATQQLTNILASSEGVSFRVK